MRNLAASVHDADMKDVEQSGRGPMRRLTRDEYQQNLRDVLALPKLDIRDMLPEDREAWHFNKTAEVLDISRVRLAAYLDAAEAALQQAIAIGVEPPAMTKYRAVGRQLFAETSTFGNREAMFFEVITRHSTTNSWQNLPMKKRSNLRCFGPLTGPIMAIRRDL